MLCVYKRIKRMREVWYLCIKAEFSRNFVWCNWDDRRCSCAVGAKEETRHDLSVQCEPLLCLLVLLINYILLCPSNYTWIVCLCAYIITVFILIFNVTCSSIWNIVWKSSEPTLENSRKDYVFSFLSYCRYRCCTIVITMRNLFFSIPF